MIDNISSIYLNVELQATQRVISFYFLPFTSLSINSVSHEYRNRSANNGTQLIPQGTPTDYWKNLFPKTTYIKKAVPFRTMFFDFWLYSYKYYELPSKYTR